MNKFVEIPCERVKKKLILNIGINDAIYQIYYNTGIKRIICPFYKVWKSMLTRCYSNKYHTKFTTYTTCIVCNEWLTFSNFKSWMEQQDWEDNDLDKDLLIRGSKVYSPETCIFVPQNINKIILDPLVKSRDTPIGVCWCKTSKKYKAQCNIGKKHINLGRYTSENEAIQAYKLCKKKHIISEAMKQSNTVLRNALLNIANTEYI